MINRDWEKFGEDIRKTVQDAIDAQDFGKLNQTITNTINNAVDSVSRNIRNAQEAQQFQTRGRDPVNRRFGSQDTVRGRNNRRNGYSGQENGHGIRRQKQPLALYRKPAGVQAGGTLTTVFGAVAGGMFSVALVFFVITALMAGAFGIPEIMVTALFLIFAAAGFVACGFGAGIRGRVKRFRTYVQVLGMREYCNIRELSERVHKSVKFVVKDLEYMFAKGWFLEGHLDDEKTCLITSHGMYQQYKQIQADRRVTEQEKAANQQRAEDKGYVQEKQGTESGRSKLPPEVQKVVEEGDAYIRKIHACNDAISGAEISAKISHMEMLVDKIFDRVEQEPEAVDDIRRLMEYYLPTTVKLLEAYRELDAQPIDGENIRSSKREIEATLDTLNLAFEKLLDGLFQETAWDVSSDISVLHTMLAQEGLTDDGLHKPN